MKRYFREVTDSWVCDYRVPCHTYIFENKKCIGYIKEGDTVEQLFSKPSSQFSKTGRMFMEVTNEYR